MLGHRIRPWDAGDPTAGHLPRRCAGGLPMSPKSDDVLLVHGGSPLHGEGRVRGAKNLVSKAMVAALLDDAPSRLYDLPRIRGVQVVRGLLEPHGLRIYEA